MTRIDAKTQLRVYRNFANETIGFIRCYFLDSPPPAHSEIENSPKSFHERSIETFAVLAAAKNAVRPITGSRSSTLVGRPPNVRRHVNGPCAFDARCARTRHVCTRPGAACRAKWGARARCARKRVQGRDSIRMADVFRNFDFRPTQTDPRSV